MSKINNSQIFLGCNQKPYSLIFNDDDASP